MTTPEFAQRIGAISTEIDQPVCAYVNRRGQIVRVGVGTPSQTQIPPLELPRYGAERLCGIRCIATQLGRRQPPGTASLTALALQRLDALAVLALSGTGFQRRGGGATGYVEAAYLAHLVPQRAGFADARPVDPEDGPGKLARRNGKGADAGGDAPAETPRDRALPAEPEAAALVVAGTAVSEALSLEALAEEDFFDLVEGLEEEFRREFVALQTDSSRERVLLVGLHSADRPMAAFEEGLQELGRLVDTAGGEVVDVLRQRRSRPHPQTVLGAGKVQELALAVQTLGATLVAFDRDLSPAQARNLEERVGVRVVDRTEVILDIFAQRAQSGAGKLQVELAQLEYRLPRLAGRGQAMSRLGGGIGTRGPGETQLETERRAIQRRIARLQKDVNHLQAHRGRLRQHRQKQDLPVLAIVGYTNAGKSTLLNALTEAEVYAADQLFATLDPTTRRLAVPDDRDGEVRTLLLTDTVGFIHELPASLIDAFRATLEEVTEADALVHLVDLSHPAWERQIRSVTDILKAMPLPVGPVLLAFNKIDRADGQALAIARERYPQAAFLSARDRLGLETLRQRLLLLVDYAFHAS